LVSARLGHSNKFWFNFVGLPAPDLGEIRAALDAVLGEESLPLGRVRITYTGGSAPLARSNWRDSEATARGDGKDRSSAIRRG